MSDYCMIVAELGINANGDINIAKKMIKNAKEAGCDFVKFQKRTIDVVYSKEELDKKHKEIDEKMKKVRGDKILENGEYDT